MQPSLFPRNLTQFPRGWTKPQYPVLDRTHPINRGIVGCWVMGEQFNVSLQNLLLSDIAGAHHALSNQNGSSAIFQSTSSHHGGTSITTNDEKLLFDTSTKISDIWGTVAGTACGWFKPSCTFNSGLIETLLDSNSFQLANHYSDNNIYFGMDAGGAGRAHVAASASNWPSGAWAFYACTWVNGGTTTAYVNGANVATGSGTSQGTSSNLRFSWNYFAGPTYGTTAAHSFDMIRLYNRALSDDEILRLYSEPYAGIYNAVSRLVGKIAVVTVKGSTLPMMAVG